MKDGRICATLECPWTAPVVAAQDFFCTSMSSSLIVARDGHGVLHVLLVADDFVRYVSAMDARLKRTDAHAAQSTARAFLFSPYFHALTVGTAQGFDCYSFDPLAVAAAVKRSLDEEHVFDLAALVSPTFTAKFPEPTFCPEALARIKCVARSVTSLISPHPERRLQT